MVRLLPPRKNPTIVPSTSSELAPFAFAQSKL
jgi:hypothetical protein